MLNQTKACNKRLYILWFNLHKGQTGQTTNKWIYYVGLFNRNGLGNNAPYMASSFFCALSSIKHL